MMRIKSIILIFIMLFSYCKKTEISSNNSKKKFVTRKQRTSCIGNNLIEVNKIQRYFPHGRIKYDVQSNCSNECYENKLLLPEGADVNIINFDVYPEEDQSFQVLYKENLYCIPKGALSFSEKINVLEGTSKEFDPEIWGRYILFKNGIYLEILNYLPSGGELEAPEYIGGFGKYIYLQNKLKLCNYQSFFKNKKKLSRSCEILNKTNNDAWATEAKQNDAHIMWLQKLNQKGAEYWEIEDMIYTEISISNFMK